MSKSLNSIAMSAMDLVSRVETLAREYVSENQRPTRMELKARDMDRRSKRQIKGRIHAYSTAD